MKKILAILIIIMLFNCGINKTLVNNVIHLHEIKTLHFFDIKINGKRAKLLVDTGASKSLLDINRAEEYGFKYILLAKDKYLGLGGTMDVFILYEYIVEPFHIPFLGTDLTEIAGYFDGKIPIVGVLGIDFLEQHYAKIDLKRNKIQLYYSDTIEVQIIESIY